jgi:hypothetical protein
VGQSFRDANFDAEVGDGGQSTARGRSLHIYQFMKKVTGKYIISLARYASPLSPDKAGLCNACRPFKVVLLRLI